MDEYSPMVRDKLVWLVDRLEQLIIEDGRQATTFRVTIRDCIRDKDKKFHKESRQGKVAPRLFFLEKGGMRASAKTELVDIGLSLVEKMLSMTTQIHITLLGVTVTDFIDQVETKSSIRRFFSPTKCETTTTFSNIETTKPVVNQVQEEDGMKSKKRKIDFMESDGDIVTNTPDQKFECPSDCDPSVWMALPTSVQKEILSDRRIATPEDNMTLIYPEERSNKAVRECPLGMDPQVFNKLPQEIQQEILNNEKIKPSSSVKPRKSRVNKIENYFSVKSKRN